MTSLSKLQAKLKSFKKDTSGNFLILTALMMFVIIGTAGFALDYSRVFNAQSKIAGAADSAVLAVGNNLLNGITDEDENRQAFEAMLSANLQGIIPVGSLDISSFIADPETGEVKADINTNMPMTLMRVLGFEDVDITITAGAIFEQEDVEVVMVLDNTGSMKDSRIEALRRAATDAVNLLIPGETSNTVRIGLVPYAASVNAGRFAEDATEGNDEFDVASLGGDEAIFTSDHRNVPTDSCVTERGGFEAATDASFENFPVGSDERTVNPNSARQGCPSLEIRPLTSNKSNLLGDINDMRTRGPTAGHIGIAWGYYMLSENWKKLWPSSAEPTPYSQNVNKVAIIMTDGIFNTFYNGTENFPGRRNQTDQDGVQAEYSRDLSLELCNNMKAARAGHSGIKVYTVAFEAPTEAQNLLQQCANDDTAQDQFYFEADNEEELQQAFRKIAESIQSLRLAQ